MCWMEVRRKSWSGPDPVTSQASGQIRRHSEEARNQLLSSDKGATGQKDPLLTRDK